MTDMMKTDGYDRVRAHTSQAVNARIDRSTDGSLAQASDDSEYALRRLGELEREWEIDRAILLGFAAMGSVALTLGLRKDWRWRFPLAGQIAFLLLHATIGWCPPAMVLRRLGVRTRQEIEAERHQLLSVQHAAAATVGRAS